MKPHRTSLLPLVCLVTVVGANAPSESRAAAKCKPSEVFVESKTPVRRGPGLNYPVASFLEKGRCLRLGEVSLDKSWVLVKLDEIFGWVPTDRLSNASQDKVLAVGEASGSPVGSGQKRGLVSSRKPTPLLAKPSGDAEALKTLPAAAKLVALSVSLDEAFVEVRDERGQVGWVKSEDLEAPDKVLELLPRTDAGVDHVMGEKRADLPAPPARDNIDSSLAHQQLDQRMATRADGLSITVAGFAGAAVPSHSLDSNGAEGIRRYGITAMGGAARVEARVGGGVLPVAIRAGYGFGFLTGLEAEGDAGSIGGMSHEIHGAIELPLQVGERTRLSPELGYVFLDYGLDPALPGAEVGQFFSSQSHLVSAGLGLLHRLPSDIGLLARVAFVGGASDSYPFDLGDPGFSVGAFGTLAGYLPLGRTVDLVLRYDLRFRTGGFSGQSAVDDTISEATLSDFVNGLSAGVSWTLD